MDIRTPGVIVLSKAAQGQLVSRVEPYIFALQRSKTAGDAVHASGDLEKWLERLTEIERAFVLGVLHGVSLEEKHQAGCLWSGSLLSSFLK